VKQAVRASWIVSKRPLNSWTCRGQHNRTETKTEKNPGTNGSNLPRDLQDKKNEKKTRNSSQIDTIYNLQSNAIKCYHMQLNSTLKKVSAKKMGDKRRIPGTNGSNLPRDLQARKD
jgi:hypothetical protein